MTERSGYDRARQRAVLSKLRRNAGLEISDVSHAVGLSYPQVVRYLDGRTPLHAFRVPTFARALGVDPLDLAAELNGTDVIEDHIAAPDKPLWNFRDALRGKVHERVIEQMAPEVEKWPLIRQQAAAEVIIQMYQRHVSDNTSPLVRHASAG